MTCRRPLCRAVASAVVAVAVFAHSKAGSGGQTPPAVDDWSTIPADRPVPRRDENSHVAHTDLLAKAKQGRIDVYFVGDSITRRWGATDYPQLLAHWRENFFGWNAANFGWGGERTQHILWRLENGELDGLTPRIIVVQAGANNMGNTPGDGARVEDITRGITAIVSLCRSKVPNAVIILTAMFPRGDASLAPEIARINANLARVADGTRIRFLNVNDKLADASGRLLESVSPDGLHLNVSGYQAWADGLKPIVQEILGPPAATDQAPPPTGDPGARSRPAR
jgi:lysophospholipase L1-like esterase